MSTLVIVESPGKIKKIREYLGPGFQVEASVGHIRDLPSRKEQIPEQYRDKPWANIGIDPETFNPIYVVLPDKQDVVRNLRSHAGRCDRVLFAMDADREGEAIAWHVSRVLGIERPQRIVFTEITKSAIQEAVRSPRAMDMGLVAAQETRRAIDRFVGYGVSPLLWDTVGKNPETGRVASAGRVQSAALMMLTQRELARMTFRSAAFHIIRCDTDTRPSFAATVTHLRDTETEPYRALGKASDFGPNGQLKTDARLLTEAEALLLVDSLRGREATVVSVEQSEVRSKPAPPFITSTLQQAASRVRLNAKKIMEVAQKLYEGGYTTYMRTDSTSLSDEALHAARKEVERLFGAAALPQQPRQYATRNKNAQEAHEAIRPTGSSFRAPETLDLDPTQMAVYTLIYQRTVASQMQDTLYDKTVVTLTTGRTLLHGQGQVLRYAGHTRLLQDEQTGQGGGGGGGAGTVEAGGSEDQPLPPLVAGQRMTLTPRRLEHKETSPPPRYTEKTLVKAMEASGIGRPSTYAQTLSVLYDRGYVREAGGGSMGVTAFGLLNITYLNRQVPDIIAREFTAQMEQELDQIAQGQLSRKAFLTKFYTNGLLPLIGQATKTAPDLKLPHLGGVTLCASRDGPQLLIGGRRIAFPQGVVPGDLRPDDVPGLLSGEYTPPRSASAGARRGRGEGETESSAPTHLVRPGSSGKRKAASAGAGTGSRGKKGTGSTARKTSKKK